MATDATIVIHDRTVAVAVRHGRMLRRERRALAESAATLSAERLAQVIAEAACALEVARTSVSLVIPTTWCYVHPVSLAQRRPSHTMLAYALEEFLPTEIEQLARDFLRTGPGQYVGVAVERQRLSGLLEACAAAGLYVEHVTLDVLQAAQSLPEASSVLWCDEEHVAVLARRAGAAHSLRVIRLAAGLSELHWQQHVLDHLRAGALPDGDAVAVTGCLAEDRLDRLARELGAQRSALPDAVHACGRDGRFNLARDGLAAGSASLRLLRTWRRTAAVTLAALLLVAAALGLQRQRLSAQLSEIANWERGLYRELFPGQPPPPGIALRIASERRRLEGLTLAGPSALQPPFDAVATLRVVMAALPADVALDLDEVRIEEQAVTLRGRTRDHQQAERLATALNSAAGLACPAPRTDRHREGGVQFFVSATREIHGAGVGRNQP